MSRNGQNITERFIPTRRSLISRLRNSDDQESWRVFFDTYWKLIYSFALKRGCTNTEGEEVVQETIIALSKTMPAYKYDPAACSFKGWLMHLTNCRVVDQLRKRDHRVVWRSETGSSKDSALANIPDAAASELEAVWKEEWERHLIDAALQRVKRKANAQHYQIFHLHFIKKYSPEQICELLSVGRGQVYLAKHRVGAMVKKEIKQLEKKML
jgi:RNA polymerase sigma factor (sigma-70 family)